VETVLFPSNTVSILSLVGTIYWGTGVRRGKYSKTSLHSLENVFSARVILRQSATDFASHLHITLGNRKKCLVLGKVACLKSWKMLWSMRWRFLLQQGSKWTFSSNCTIPMSYGLLQASCGLLAYASVFHICRSYFEYLDVAFPSVIASLPNANALSAPYPAFQKLCCISLNVPNILEHWSLGVELEFVAIIASRSIFLRFSNEGHRRSLSTTPTGNLKQSTSGIFDIDALAWMRCCISQNVPK